MVENKWLWKIKGEKPGKIVVIMAGVHGNEVGGIKALKRAIKEIKINSGNVYYILGNLRAISKNVRQIESNLNRSFTDARLKNPKTYEEKRAKELATYLDEADAILDLHSSRNKSSVPFAIFGPKSLNVAKKLDFDLITTGWDEIEPGSTNYYLNEKGRVAITVETGQHLDEASSKRAFKSIQTFLNLMGLTDEKVKMNDKKQKRIDVNYIYITKNNLKIVKNFNDFEKIKKGDLIGMDGHEKIYSVQDGIIVFAHDIDKSGEEGFVLGRER
jgi:succinylglutamate desuccinylase